jgi:iron complex transport system permease protein
MRPLTLTRLTASLGIAIAILIGAVALAICVGSSAGFGWPSGAFAQEIFASRRDVAMLATIVGLGLGAAGAAYQSVLRNDLADPYLLGIASGAAVGAYAWRLPFIAAAFASLGDGFLNAGQPAFAFIGAIAAAATVLALSGGAMRRVEPSSVVLVGVIVSTLCGAIVLLMFTFAKSMPGSGSVQSVMIGELQTSLTRVQFWTAAITVIVGTLALWWRSPQLNVVALGDDEARAMGLRTHRERLFVLAVASLVTAAAVSVSGPIGFVGLIAPHVARRIVGSDARLVLPVAAIAGAILLVLADALLRFLVGAGVVHTLIPIGVATALLGAPFFLAILFRAQRKAER